MPHYEEIKEVTKGNIDFILEIQKFNPYHDRLGRFSSAGAGFSVGMGTAGGAVGGNKAAINETLKNVESANKGLDHEVATIVNPNTGKAIFSKEGNRYGVSFNPSEAREISGKILTHNHPDEVIFSPKDVAMSYHLDTIRATNPDGKVYELTKMRRRDAVLEYEKHYMSARSESFKKLGVSDDTPDSKLTNEQRKASFSEISESCHKWLTDNAGTYGYQYNRGRIE